MVMHRASLPAHVLALSPGLSRVPLRAGKPRSVGLLGSLARRLRARQGRKALKRLGRRTQGLRKLLRGRKSAQKGELVFLAEAMGIHDQIVGRLSPELGSSDICLSWRGNVLSSLERQVQLGQQARALQTARTLPSTVLPSTRLDERVRRAALEVVLRSGERAEQERADILQGMRDVLASMAGA